MNGGVSLTSGPAAAPGSMGAPLRLFFLPEPEISREAYTPLNTPLLLLYHTLPLLP